MPATQVIDAVLEHWIAIQVAAARHGIPPHILAGLVAQESGGCTWAVRYEPGYRWLVTGPAMAAAKPGICSTDTEISSQKHSWGLCQVMGAVARERGHKGWISEMLDPEVGLEMGAAHLGRGLKAEGGDIRRALQRYNTGSGKIPDKLGETPYCDKVLAWAEHFKPRELRGDNQGA